MPQGHGAVQIPTFPNARYLVSRTEYDHFTRPEFTGERRQIFTDSLKPILDHKLLELLNVPAKGFDVSPDIRLVSTPGHTPGHVSVELTSAGKVAMISGDVLHHPIQLAHSEWNCNFDADAEQAVSTRRIFLDKLADSDTLIIGTHFPAPTVGWIRRDGDTYRFQAAQEQGWKTAGDGCS
ncbi:MAG: hypothetical protein ACR2JX_10630 [Mycobacteriales bacterium]